MARLFESDTVSTFGVTGIKQLHELSKTADKFLDVMTLGMALPADKGHEQAESKIDNWLADHYNDSLGHKIGSMTGEQAGNLPAYILANGIVRGVIQPSQLQKLGKPALFTAKRLMEAAEGYMAGKATGEKDASGTAIAFAGFGTAGAMLGGARRYIGKLLGIGGPKLVAEVMARAATPVEEAVKTTNPLSERINQANREVLNAFSKAHYNGQLFHFLPKVEKEKVLDAIAQETVHQTKNIAASNPELVQKFVAKSVQKQMESSPVFKQSMDTLAKGGLKPEDIVKSTTETVVKRARINTGEASTPAAMRKLVVGAAKADSPEFLANMLKSVQTNFKIENPKHKLVFIWGIKDQLPKQLQTVLKQHMEHEFPGTNAHNWAKMVKALDEHVADLQTTGKLGERVFRSTSLSGQKTEWQKKMMDMADIIRTGKAVRNVPEASKAVKAVVRNTIRAKDFIDNIQIKKPGPGAASALDPNFLSAGFIRTSAGGKNFVPDPQLSVMAKIFNGTFQSNPLKAAKTSAGLMFHVEKAIREWQVNGGFQNWGRESKHFIETGNVAADSIVAKDAAMIVQLVRHAEPRKDTIYRGIQYNDVVRDMFKNLKPGDEFVIKAPSSFTFKSENAKAFGNHMLVIEGGFKGLNASIHEVHSREAEVITHGRFKVMQISKVPLDMLEKHNEGQLPRQSLSTAVIRLKQIEVF